MELSPRNFLIKASILLRFLMLLFLCCISDRANLCCNHTFPTLKLKALDLDGDLSFENTHEAAKDFGNIYHLLPSAILYPKSVHDISLVIKHVFEMGFSSELKVAAKGHGHSIQGQAQAHNGIVINMESLKGLEMKFHKGQVPYVDVYGGELWINILHESIKHGLAPKSWTDYLHLTVGGTLSNAGISGQAFRHGPQIDNVYQLEVVTGKGEVVTCSDTQNSELFYAVLGGLGQFGIITRARISLEPSPKMVKWIRVLYSDFVIFTKDQEKLISSDNAFDYIEGFVIINRTGLINNWRLSFNPKDPLRASEFNSEGRTLFCLEMALYFNPEESDTINLKMESLLSKLDYIPSTVFLSDVSYVEFLDRVHVSEINLRAKGLWEVPHPWMNLLIPNSRIHDFGKEVFGKILTDTSNGPILIYPVNKSRWNNRTSMVTPDEDELFLVAFLSSAMPSSTGPDGLEQILTQHRRILEFCESAQMGVKQYLPHYTTQKEWQTHFSLKWENFVQRKMDYDPLAILAPGQKIFTKPLIHFPDHQPL